MFYSLLSVRIYSYAEGDNVVYREAGVLPQLNWTYFPNPGNYTYYVDDASGIPTGGGYYFWKYGNDNKFAAIQQSKIFTYMLNTGIGLTCSSERLATLISAYYTSIANLDTGVLYDGVGNKLGIVLNDISGCVYEAYPQSTDITIPSTEINNVYNWYHYYITVEHPIAPDYITFQTYRNDAAFTQVDVSNSYYNALNSALNSLGNGLAYGFEVSPLNTYSSEFYYIDNTDFAYYSDNDTRYTNFCRVQGLFNNGDTVGYTNILANKTASSALSVNFYNCNSNQLINPTWVKYTLRTDGTYSTSNENPAYNFLAQSSKIITSKSADKLTVYRDNNVFTQIVNKTYAPSTYTSTTYNNYDTNSDNSISTNTSVVNNSTTTNNDIYNDASQSFSEYYSSQDNYNIDNSVVINNTTEIIYNYYGDDIGGGGGGSDDNDDDPIWDAILNAIVDFFKKIGQLIGALLAGLLELINTVLDAFANINNSFDGIKNFLSSIFSWFPSEIVTLMVLGLGLALLASFITWFKR